MKHLYIFLLLLPTWLSAQISGQVQVGNSPSGLAGCTVRAYNQQAQLVATATTSANGSYELAVPAAQTVRVELSLPAATVAGSMAWSLVGRQSRSRMVKSPATVQNWQAHQPQWGSVAAPRAATPVYLHAATQAPEAAQQPAIILSALEGDSRTALATFEQVGAVWGLAHDATRNQVYAATLAKRHVGFGPAGSGAIYRSTVGTTANAQLLYDFDANGIATRPAELERELAATLGKAAKDAPIFSHIGQMSLGGMDLSADGRVLYVMNLYNRTLYGLYLKGTAEQLQVAGVVSYPLPVVTAKGGNWRPFAVKYHANRVFVGAVNDAAESQNAADATAIVWSLDPAQKQYTEVMRLPLNYPRASAAMQWHPWTNDLNAAKQSAYPSYLAYAQPILSDIEFDKDGAMLLGLMDRLGHQTGTDQPDLAGRGVYTGVAAGDVLRVALQKPLSEATQKQWSKNLRVEQNAQAGTHSTAGSHNGEGPAGGEFYFADAFRWQNETIHAETGAGGLALWHNGPQTQLLHSAHEPTAAFNNAGFSIFDAQTGASLGGVALYRNMQLGYFAKANGVGDIELVSEAAPIAVGSQLWWDTNQNGLFDPEELPMGGTTLELYAGSELMSSTQTNQAGEYWFDFQNVAGGLRPQMEYEIRLANLQQGKDLLKPSTGTLTQQGTALSQNEAEVRLRFRTGDAGHTHDGLNMGFEATPAKPAVAVEALAVNEGDAELVVYPNPLSRDAQVQLTNQAQGETLQVIDLTGRVLHEQKMSGSSSTLEATRLPSGKFILRVQTDKGVFNKGVVKE